MSTIEEKLHLTVDGSTREVVIRHGEAACVYDPVGIYVRGDITTVSRFINGRLKFISEQAYVIANIESGTITYLEDPTNHFGAKAQAHLESSGELAQIQHSFTNRMTLEALTQAVRRYRFYFADKEEHKELLVALSEFSIKVETTIDNSDNRRGDVYKRLMQEVECSIPHTFVLEIPLYKNTLPKRVVFDLLFELYDNSARFTVESVELQELLYAEREQLILDEIEKVRELGITTLFA